jgi:AmiR/NasT family two-component response regulator
MLMAIHGIDADQAFERLRIQSQNTNTPLHRVATTSVEQLRTTSDSSDSEETV